MQNTKEKLKEVKNKIETLSKEISRLDELQKELDDLTLLESQLELELAQWEEATDVDALMDDDSGEPEFQDYQHSNYEPR